MRAFPKLRSFFRLPDARQAGFTLVELMVSISIFAVMTLVVMLKQSDFSGSTLLTNAAYEVALLIRKAQTYGLNVRELQLDNGTKLFNIGYGVHVEQQGGTPLRTFVLFADLPPNPSLPIGSGNLPDGRYDPDTDIAIEELTLKKEFSVSQYCAHTPSGSDHDCYQAGMEWMDISFVRPNPEAKIKGQWGDEMGYRYARADITLAFNGDSSKSKTIRVEETGQISIDQ